MVVFKWQNLSNHILYRCSLFYVICITSIIGFLKNIKSYLGPPEDISRRRQWHPTPVLLLGKIPWMEEPGRLQSMGSLESDTTQRLHFHFSLSYIGEGNGNPLQCSCLENPRDGGPWWAAVSGVTQSRTLLMQLTNKSTRSTKHLQNTSPHAGNTFYSIAHGTFWTKTDHMLGFKTHLNIF